jgi:hypothetical protein
MEPGPPQVAMRVRRDVNMRRHPLRIKKLTGIRNRRTGIVPRFTKKLPKRAFLCSFSEKVSVATRNPGVDCAAALYITVFKIRGELMA